MTPISPLKSRLIDKILVTKNEQLLEAIDGIFSSTTQITQFELDSNQEQMLEMSDEDIENGKVVSQKDLTVRDRSWMS
jgi:hypothetical protein